MKPALLLLLAIGPVFGFFVQAANLPPGNEIVTSWLHYGPLGLTAITAIIVASLLVRQNVTLNKDFAERLDVYQGEWRQSVERITEAHHETMQQVADDLRAIIIANTAELSKSTQTRGEAIQIIGQLKRLAACPYAERIEDHPAFKPK